jgi:hypothetical protein
MKLPKAEQHLEEWQAATEAPIMAAEDRGPLMHARIGMLRALNRHIGMVFDSSRKDTHWRKRKLTRDQKMTVLIYVYTSKQVGDADHLRVFANPDAAETWFEENDPEGVAFEREVLE